MAATGWIGLLLFGLAGYQLFRGRYMTSDDYHNREVVDRQKTPFQFWFAIVAEVVLGVLLVFGIIRF